MIILPFIPILALLIQTSFSLYDILQYRSEVNEIESQVNMFVAARFSAGKSVFMSKSIRSIIILILSTHTLDE